MHGQLIQCTVRCVNCIYRGMHNGLLMDMQEEVTKETGPGTASHVPSDKPEDPTRKDKPSKKEWVCIMKNLTHPQ